MLLFWSIVWSVTKLSKHGEEFQLEEEYICFYRIFPSWKLAEKQFPGRTGMVVYATFDRKSITTDMYDLPFIIRDNS